jgi:CPA2 family monovalent cation:H+ antiporter-2
VVKKNRSEEFRALWIGSRHNRAPLTFTIIARVAIAMSYVGYILSNLTDFSNALMLSLAICAVITIVYSRRIKKQSITLERLFFQNLQSREMAARAMGRKRPLFEGKLLDRDIHIATVDVPQDSQWAGKTLKELKLGQRFGVHVSSIVRGHQKINIPSGDNIIFPYDQLNVIGSDAQLAVVNTALQEEQYPEPTDFAIHEMQLRRFSVGENSMFVGKSLITSKLRDEYNCMLVGLEEGQENLTSVSPLYLFKPGDILWIVGEDQDIKRLANEF